MGKEGLELREVSVGAASFLRGSGSPHPSLYEARLSGIKYSLSSQIERTSSVSSPCRRSEEHTSELQSLMRISYAVFCLKKKNHSYTVRMHTYAKQQQ